MVFIALVTVVVPVQAEVYKWQDRDGKVRYTDTPPPIGAKQISTIGKKVEKPIVAKPVTNVDSASKTGAAAAGKEKKADNSTEAEAKKKRDLEEIAKKNKAELETQAKKREFNCATAKTNFQTYSQGGRIYKTNEKGVREYVNEQGLAEGAAQAQHDIQEYCS
jgi:hypothetical protein